MTEIKSCNCDGHLGNKQGAQFQSKRYGENKRVHNVVKRESNLVYRCTVCGKESTTSSKK